MPHNTGTAAVVSTTPYIITKDEKAIRSTALFAQPLIPYEPLDVQTGADTLKYSETARNPVVKTALDIIINGALQLRGNVMPMNDYDLHPAFEDIDDTVVKMINSQIERLNYVDWETVQRSLLYNAMVFGFAVAEKNFDKKGLIYRIKEIKTKPSFNFEVYVNEFDEIESLNYFEVTQERYLDPRKFIVSPFPVLKEGNYYGVSELQSIRHDVKVMELLERKRAEGVSSLMVKPIIHKYINTGRSKDDTAAAHDSIDKFDESSVIHLPADRNESGDFVPGDMLEVLPNRSEPDVVEDMAGIIVQHEKKINRALGIPDDMGISTTTSGSFAKARVENNIFNLKLLECQQWLENTINSQIFPDMVKFNFKYLPDEYRLPQWKYTHPDDDINLQKAEYFALLITNGIIPADSPHIKEQLNLPSTEGEDIDGIDNNI